MTEKTKRTKKVCSIYIHSDLREKVKKNGINMSAICENALENLVEKIEKAELWKNDQKENEEIGKNGKI